MIEVLSSGALLTIQDQGRPGYAALGVPRSGAMDRRALATANRLVGNPEQAAGLEAVLGCCLRFHTAATVAVAGAPTESLKWGEAITVAAGSLVEIAAPVNGLRHYVAVRGGIDATVVLGSRSTDTLSGLGPARLRAGDYLATGPEPAAPPGRGHAIPAPLADAPLRVMAGPREDWFVPDALALLATAEWSVRSESNRVGLRLDGPVLARGRDGELRSEPTLPGALQVPPNGRPIIFGPDAPVTGGYPVIAVLREDDLGRLAQLRPGDILRFINS
ncbi:MAG TPA: biotin-dependent carboxyltransferase family protein [Jatrophihabitans sp.]|jgi:biotin-dependent carboxylase-like uncharacterized protein